MSPRQRTRRKNAHRGRKAWRKWWAEKQTREQQRIDTIIATYPDPIDQFAAIFQVPRAILMGEAP